MLYRDARNLIRNGDLLGCGSVHPVSTAIQEGTGYDESHPEIAVWCRFGQGVRHRLCSWGSVGSSGGVRLIPVSLLLEKYKRLGGHVYLHPLSRPGVGDRITSAAEARWVAGTGYPSLWQHVLTACPWLGWLYRFIRRRATVDIDVDAQHCAEFVAAVLADAGYDWGCEPCELAPGEVLRSKWHGLRYEISLQGGV